MPKGKPKYRGEFKQMVVETMRKEKLSYLETEQSAGFDYVLPLVMRGFQSFR